MRILGNGNAKFALMMFSYNKYEKQGNWNRIIITNFNFCNDNISQDPLYTKYSRTTAEGRRTWAAIEEFNDSLKFLKNNIEVTLEYEEKPYQYPDTRPSIIAARSSTPRSAWLSRIYFQNFHEIYRVVSRNSPLFYASHKCHPERNSSDTRKR